MKNKVAGIMLLIVFAACAANQKDAWFPYVGCPRQELIEHWGEGHSFFDGSIYDVRETVWYHQRCFSGNKGCKINPGKDTKQISYAIYIHNDVIERIERHH
jgi:hypothetical protein